jgi:ATP-dependent DNA helicase RecG
MGKHTSKPRNPKMAEAFYRAGFIEAWGRGIEKIVNGFKADGLTPPTFEIEQGGMTVNIPREKFVEISLNGGVDSEQSGHGGKDGGKDGGKEFSTQYTKKQRVILDTIKKNPAITIDALSETLAVKKRTLERYIAELQRCGILKREGGKKNGVWVVVVNKVM